MRKLIIALAALTIAATTAFADEGMWLPALVSQRIADMQAKGFKLTAEDVYSINQASLKDAVVLFGGGCTGELISDEGLLITNHHCGFRQIQRHSSVEHDYLKDGYWAMTRDQELPNEGLTVSFLDRMEDVTDMLLKDLPEETSEEVAKENSVKIAKRIKALEKSLRDEKKGVEAEVEKLFYGNQYFVFVYRIYKDVRFVGAPASSIGKFGGDTDNWMWPRHTGDFSMFRIYADKDNNPAEYSKDNVPYTPKRFFKIDRRGVKEGDFTFIYGYPGSTREYIHSEGVRYVGEISDPAKIALRTSRLEIMKKYMSADPAVRIMYAAKQASVANAWKKWQGESGGIARNSTVQQKRDFEKRFNEWAKGTGYEGLVDKIGRKYAELEPNMLAYEYYNETIRGCEIFGAKDKDYYRPIDEECTRAMLGAYYANVDSSLRPPVFNEMVASNGSVDRLVDAIFSDQALADSLYRGCTSWVKNVLARKVASINGGINALYKQYMRAQMEFEPDKAFYPDANLTLRVAYGHIAGYEPRDGVYYYPVSTLKGIIEKDNPEIYDYDIPQRLRDVYAEGGYENIPVCFIATNHTSGGNSGSPVINADGNLIGINFDRVWEGTMSDIAFDPAFCRNICLDIRYVLFLLDKVYGAQNILDELTFVD
ncbi:MAG: S46 family peptidase [Bacteroidales bacterium]|nr:S46 family peptidase [Bacteroidales bacterium]